MAHFRGSVRGNRGGVSRLGSKQSGLVVTASGWNIGVRVVLAHVNGMDIVKVYKTIGSHGGNHALDCVYHEGVTA